MSPFGLPQKRYAARSYMNRPYSMTLKKKVNHKSTLENTEKEKKRLNFVEAHCRATLAPLIRQKLP